MDHTNWRNTRAWLFKTYNILVNILLKFQMLISQNLPIFFVKKIW